MRWCNCLDCRDSGSTMCTGKLAAMGARHMALLEDFSSLWQQAVREPVWLVLSCCLVHQALKGPASLELLCCSAVSAGMWGERGYSDDSIPYTRLSSIALLPWLPGFPPQALPTTVLSLIVPWAIPSQSIADLILGLFHNPYTPAPSHCAF